ncbi:MAG: hypothetical protein KatS3mg076_0317 [Candidatus Binatia bacterium]|nr:MAG: hypothetical protein KatS3mg076_0317 [Candidatus Binatia bacterium]
MAEKKAKTAHKESGPEKKTCPGCGGELRVTRFTGHGPRGFFWVCEKGCGYQRRTR